MNIQRAVIFVNGNIKDAKAVKALLRVDDYLIAADGGSRHLKELGLRPHLLIGDFDSISPSEVAQLETDGSEIRRYPAHKDETDLELTLQIALERGYRHILIIAALGGRLDHTLGNLFLLGIPELSDCRVCLDDGIDEVFLIHRECIVEGLPGDIVSLIALGEAASDVTTMGLGFPLRGEVLYAGRTRGISNVMLETQAKISFKQGRLLCIHTRKGDSR